MCSKWVRGCARTVSEVGWSPQGALCDFRVRGSRWSGRDRGLSHTGDSELRNQASDATALTTPPRGSRIFPGCQEFPRLGAGSPGIKTPECLELREAPPLRRPADLGSRLTPPIRQTPTHLPPYPPRSQCSPPPGAPEAGSAAVQGRHRLRPQKGSRLLLLRGKSRTFRESEGLGDLRGPLVGNPGTPIQICTTRRTD